MLAQIEQSGPSKGTVRAPVIVIDGFLPPELAEGMRADIDAHFRNPERHTHEVHQVWNYWFVPELYTYLRANPEKVIGRERVERFVQQLRGWALTTLGLANVTWPYLSLYVPGCRQNWHNDATNGRFAFVYSLTRDTRQTVGGQTLIQHEGDPVRRNIGQPAAGRGLYDAVEPRFNRLIVFDDRLPHAVERIEGTMDPTEGRLVLHGHLSEAGLAVAGALAAEIVAAPIHGAIEEFFSHAVQARSALYTGPLAIRIDIEADGKVKEAVTLMDRVIHLQPGDVEWDALVSELLARLSKLRFPPAGGGTIVIRTIAVGNRPAGR